MEEKLDLARARARAARKDGSIASDVGASDEGASDDGARDATLVREPAAVLATGPRLFGDFLPPAEPQAEVAAAPRAPRWRALFAGASPREILARIVPEDPLGMRAIVARRLQERSLLLDADRVHLRSLALCARWAPRYQGQPELADWLARLVDQAIAEVVSEEQEDARELPSDALPPERAHGDPAGDATASVRASREPEGAFETLARPLGLDARAMRAACRAFNRLPECDRGAFFDLLLRGRSLDDVVRATGRGAIDVARSARRALEPFVRADAPRAPARPSAPPSPVAREERP